MEPSQTGFALEEPSQVGLALEEPSRQSTSSWRRCSPTPTVAQVLTTVVERPRERQRTTRAFFFAWWDGESIRYPLLRSDRRVNKLKFLLLQSEKASPDRLRILNRRKATFS